jgi:hypothetical protein
MDSQSILSAMEQDLERFSLPAPGELTTLAASLDIFCKHLRHLPDWGRQADLSDPAAEVAFFKAQLPAIEGHLYFYSQVLEVEQYVPHHSSQNKIVYYHSAFHRIETAYPSMGEFYFYHQLASTHLDDVYFPRRITETQSIQFTISQLDITLLKNPPKYLKINFPTFKMLMRTLAHRRE